MLDKMCRNESAYHASPKSYVDRKRQGLYKASRTGKRGSSLGEELLVKGGVIPTSPTVWVNSRKRREGGRLLLLLVKVHGTSRSRGRGETFLGWGELVGEVYGFVEWWVGREGKKTGAREKAAGSREKIETRLSTLRYLGKRSEAFLYSRGSCSPESEPTLNQRLGVSNPKTSRIGCFIPGRD